MKSIDLISGSIFAGNPVNLRVTPSHVSGNNIAFHRIVVNVIASLVVNKTESDTITIPMSVSLYNEQPQDIDISSALRSVLDSYEYTPQPAFYPIVKWYVEGYDEYMDDGVIQSKFDIKRFPAESIENPESEYLYCIAGSMPETQRILLPALPSVSSFSDKPSTPHIFNQTVLYAYPEDLTEGISLLDSHKLENICVSCEDLTDTGLVTIGGKQIYVLDRDEEKRQTFRFINRYGVLETINVPYANEVQVDIEKHEYSSGTIEYFNSIRHGIVHKSNNRETLSFTTDPLDEEWLFWYINEFLMAENVWMEYKYDKYPHTTYIRCHILPDETVKAITRTSNNTLTLTFKVKLDINGHLPQSK